MKPKRPGSSGPSRSTNLTVRVKWSSSLLYTGPYPVPVKRFFQLETLTHAIEKCLYEKDRFLWAGLKSLFNNLPINSLQCDLIYEDSLRLIYALALASQSRKQAQARLVIAKNHEECSAILEKECAALTQLAARCPDTVAPVIARGVIFLPDRHMRREVNREVFAYICTVPTSFAPLYVASSTQFAPHGPKPFRYSIKDTEILKASMIGVIAGCYDEKSGTGIFPADLTPECFAAPHPLPQGNVAARLLQCPRVGKRMSPARMIHNLLFATLVSGKNRIPLAPIRPELFFDALTSAVDREKAIEWCNAFMIRHKGRRDDVSPDESAIELPGRDYIDVLVELAGI